MPQEYATVNPICILLLTELSNIGFNSSRYISRKMQRAQRETVLIVWLKHKEPTSEPWF